MFYSRFSFCVPQVQLGNAGNGRWFYADYATFSLGSGSTKYVLNLSGFNGGTDSLINTSMPSNRNLNGMRFSTPDADNDKSTATPSCAQKFVGGWWFNSCHNGCLTCDNVHFRMESLSYVTESGGPLRAARMMIIGR